MRVSFPRCLVSVSRARSSHVPGRGDREARAAPNAGPVVVRPPEVRPFARPGPSLAHVGLQLRYHWRGSLRGSPMAVAERQEAPAINASLLPFSDRHFVLDLELHLNTLTLEYPLCLTRAWRRMVPRADRFGVPRGMFTFSYPSFSRCCPSVFQCPPPTATRRTLQWSVALYLTDTLPVIASASTSRT